MLILASQTRSNDLYVSLFCVIKILRMEIKSNGENGVGENELGALEPIALAVGDDRVRDQNREKDRK